MLLVAWDDPLPDSGEQHQQSDTSYAEFVCDGPKEDEQSDSGTDVLDAFRPVVLWQAIFEDSFRQGLSGCQCLFHQFVLCFPVFVSEVESNEYDKERESEYQYDDY